MQISLNWMNEFVDLSDKTTEEIAHNLTMSGLEVEGIEILKPKFTNITTAKILKIDVHPNADKLHLVTVETNLGTKTVVCGAQNIAEGQIIPYATIGSKVFSRKTGELYELTPAEIRGVVSQGMLCSSDELGLEGLQEEDGILILNRLYDDIKIGVPLEKVLNLEEDVILHVAPTANRGDQFSMIGVARELCSIFNKKLNFSPLQNSENISTDKFKVEILNPETCKYYSIAILKNLVTKPSPDWMQKRLIASGMRPINNIVDITNYVLLEYGQPLHAFDFDKLDGYLCVRRAKEGEKITTLDGVERELTNDSVLIATKTEPACVAGIYGGINTGIDENSKNIALESAYFTAPCIRKSSRSVGYRSEACARFEHGVDIEAVKPAMFRAISLLIKYADAKFEGLVETGSDKAPVIDITLRFDRIKKVLGSAIPADRCVEILDGLGFELLGKNEIAGKFRVPSFRANDVTREIDLIEEISRINGFDKIMPTLPENKAAAEVAPKLKTLRSLHELMLGEGFSEMITSSLIGEPLLKQFDFDYDRSQVVEMCNAQSEDYKMLRQSVIPSLLQVVKYNFDNGQKDFWLYEIGKVYFKNSPNDEKNSGVEETRHLCGVLSGNVNMSKWHNTGADDFYTVKGVMESILNELKLTNRVRFEASDVSYLHPNISAKIVLLGKTPTTVGYFGKLHPYLKQKQKMTQDIYLFDLNLELLLDNTNLTVTRFKKLPQFPEVQRDLAFVVPENVNSDEIARAIKKGADNSLFNGADIFDVYQGENIDSGSKSLAYRIKFQDAKATLTDEIVEAQMNNVRNALKKAIPDIAFRE